MKVYTLSRPDLGNAYVTDNIDEILSEIEVELETEGENTEIGFTRDNLPKFMKNVESLKALESDESGMVLAAFGPFLITAEEMSEEEYNSLEEFSGW